MNEITKDSTEVVTPQSTADKADTAVTDRGATLTGRRGVPKLGVILTVAGVLALLAFTQLSGPNFSQREVVEDRAKAVDMEYDNLDDTAAVDLGAEPVDGTGLQTEGLEGDNRSRIADDREAERNARLEMMRKRQQRQLAIQAERQRRIDAAFAQQRARENAPVMVLTSNASGSDGVNLPTAPARRPSPTAAGIPAAPPPSTFNDTLNASSIVRVGASRMPNRGFTIEAGTHLPCTLQTALDSTLSGLVTCLLPNDVRSATGQVVLLEKGSRVLGEYQGGIRQGEARIFIVWNRVVSPQGISINLLSPATDSLGRSGIAGDVETFFWRRFGGALLLSLVGDAGSALSNRASGVRETTTAPNQAATRALEEDINIRPVLRAPQGTQLQIVASRDLDFSDVYSLRLRR